MRNSLIANTAVAAIAAALALSACQRDHSDLATGTPGATEPAATQPTAGLASADTALPADDASLQMDAGVTASDATTMSYTCDDGHRVEIVETDTARVMLADGRRVEITRAAGSAPPMYSGEGLQFSVGNQGGTLSQDELGSFDCRATS
ncbi:hypothetical protein [Lysobacter sp. D1-1-M9]|uniref:hypothetical protein n=1 Tax=Novilysobacter longmucuonensis TaxID=3098603 RepID=UPI002FCADA43